jgi:adenylosuccinate synthase
MVFVIQGTQWGDEGKGKITDYIAQKMDIVCRFQGGNNAGHSIVVDGVRYALSSLPSGIISPKITNVIANGCVVNPDALIKEINTLKEKGITQFNLFISNKAHIIMPYHIDLDGAYETLLGEESIGTTKKGIGPCYMDKASRIGLRFGDLLEPEYLKKRLSTALIIKNKELEMVNKPPYKFEDLYEHLLEIGKKLKSHIIDTSMFLNQAIEDKKQILFEGAQGTMLCLDNGTYPFVTSSSPIASSVPLNAGISPKDINKVVGIVKAYTTRVGEGPFVTELHDKMGDKIRELGHEYGVVTHRPRRVGYLDLVVVKQACRLGGIDYLAMMLVDVLTNIQPLKICVAYELDGKIIDYVPSTISEVTRCKPIYKDFAGWTEDITNVTKFSELPIECQNYLNFIEDFLKTKIAFVSVGPEREKTIIKKDIF